MGNGPNGVHLVEDGNCYKARKRQTTLPAITEPKKKKKKKKEGTLITLIIHMPM
jgi:hypothetical protein